MGINLANILYVMQFQISNYIILLELLQWLECGGKDCSCIEIIIIFIKT